jgi:hypothetical protein
MSHTISQICYFSRTLINPKSHTRFNLFKKITCMVCLLSLELDSGRVINIVTKNNFFSFLFVFVMVFCVKSSENKSEIIIDNVCLTVFVTVLHN